MNMIFKNTKQVAILLGVSINKLQRACWLNQINPLPQKSQAGDFLWTEEDIQRASWQLLHKAYRPAVAMERRSMNE
jgi:hypothetical protein